MNGAKISVTGLTIPCRGSSGPQIVACDFWALALSSEGLEVAEAERFLRLPVPFVLPLAPPALAREGAMPALRALTSSTQ